MSEQSENKLDMSCKSLYSSICPLRITFFMEMIKQVMKQSEKLLLLPMQSNSLNQTLKILTRMK
jgi:hypothetical protein